MIDYFSVSYSNHVIIGDFNLEPSTGLLKHFMNSSTLFNLIKVNTCFKGKQAKFKYFNNMYCKKDAKPFWDKCKPCFSNKHSRGDTNIMLKEKGEILLKNGVIANTFSKFFDSIVKSINLFKWPDISWDSTILSSVLDRIDRIILKYKFHPSIISIKQNIHHIWKFSYRFITLEDVRLIIKDFQLLEKSKYYSYTQEKQSSR